MYKVTIIGNFSFGRNDHGGQTTKTHNVYNALCNALGKVNVKAVDTYGGWRFLFRMPVVLWSTLRTAQNIIILPAHRGVRTVAPLLIILNGLFHRRIHYCVIGGWLADMMKKKPLLRLFLKHIYCIYTETNSMRKDLQQLGFHNVQVMPNFKEIPIRSLESIKAQKFVEPYPLCTFSRVTPQKGIEQAVEVVNAINAHYGRCVFTLDIYGQIDKGEETWFENFQRTFPIYVKYVGQVPPEKSLNVLSRYFLLLFPTLFYTEGMPGTILDAYSSGLPIISSIWKNYYDIVDEGETGIGYSFGDLNQMKDALLHIAENPELLTPMRYHCLQKAKMYQPQEVIKILLSQFE